jgi:N-methylhydantoinase B
VLTRDNKVDAEATRKRRKATRDERGAPEPFNFGYQPPVREAAE